MENNYVIRYSADHGFQTVVEVRLLLRRLLFPGTGLKKIKI
jgi:hypothetical protein